MTDHPFYKVAEEVGKWAQKGASCFQKFTCESCGNRLTMEAPNVMYMKGSCDKCGHITDIVKTGCNYMLVTGSNLAQKEFENEIKKKGEEAS